MIDYPKMLYRGTEDVPDTMIVDSIELESMAIADGWRTAATFYGYDWAVPAEPKKKGKK